jgi:hypothetical protein
MAGAVAAEIVTTPLIELRQLSANRRGMAGDWRLGWRVENKGAKSLKLGSVRLPHGQFKAAEQQFSPAIELAPRGAAEFRTLVRCDEAPGLVTENAFVIFKASWLDEEWRIFARLRVAVSPEGEPVSAPELVTAQKVGFSGVPN